MQYSGAVYFEHVLVGGVLLSSTTGEWMAFIGSGGNRTWVGNYRSKASAVRRVKQFARGRR